ncbi:GNAT family N-acetyltransferase [Nitratireductor aquibiodomus]|jgi:RimJ/RimL family protein N-acetyltransferase|uniref:Aminoglycoside 6'-N-acetyltransferase n=1 Tax=Nitratireductor aquibiodomus TaxID=204799 RepID=A0A1H4KNH2_9HYPH|nr:GNAT family N-acetyltransferase [Nitratireductor aquibiodomus]SEB59933.1 aminoglycoside 6'-N-acetyltransferase [Nitratireductor aquibiodomus]
MPSEPDQIDIIPVTAGHYPLLLDWLHQPHVREWWGDPDTELAHIRDMVEGRDTTRPFVIRLDGKPIGYIQYWFVADNRSPDILEKDPWVSELPEDAVGVDLTIGEAELLSRGVGSRAVRLMVRRLLDAGHASIIIDPDRENRRAVRAYEKAGFRPIPHLEGRTGSVLIMQYDKNNETNT